ncbi:hypothetical protein [uncultured Corynebacterium sp.]|uniref:hypothetical protein n=1 Tax=uncultured Corynebacterium sp. TaxID=159447 RepID=UPI0025E84CD0|nr:hypothetical protein [uncultured Corynebacterium sp.]
MAQNDDFRGSEENFSSILDVDRILDAIGQGEPIPETESFDSNDPVFTELIAAREEAYRDIPPAPDVSYLFDEEVDWEGIEAGGAAGESSNSSRLLRTGAKAAAAGSISLTSMLIAGGVAAAIAVGGLGIAAYTNSHDALIKREDTAEKDVSELDSPNGSGEGVSGREDGALHEENVADKSDRNDKGRDDKRKKDKAKDKSGKKTSTEKSKAPEVTSVEEIPTTTILLGGTASGMPVEPEQPGGPLEPTQPIETTSKQQHPAEPTSTSRTKKPAPTSTAPRHPEPLPTLTDYNSPRPDGSG